MINLIPNDVIEILKILNDKGYEAYIVGGCVRDIIIGRTPKDWDITTSATPFEIKKCFSHTYDTGIKHGTVTAVINKNNYEITTYRIESEHEDFRHPNSVSFTKNLAEDLLRRDFTMNAIAYHPKEGYKDFFNGIKDIKSKIIRGVGNPTDRFKEDALRMLRGVRFSAQLGFDIEKNTFEAIKLNAELIKKISVERIREEIEKLIKSKYIDKLPLLWKTGLLGYISKDLERNVVNNSDKVINQLRNSQKDTICVWTIFLQGMNQKEAFNIMKYLKFDTKTLKIVSLLVDEIKYKLPQNSYLMRKKAYEIVISELKYVIDIKKSNGEDIIKSLELLENIIKNNDAITIKDIAINGSDLINIGIKDGKEIGNILKFLLDIVHKEPKKNNKDILIDIVKFEYKKIF